MKCEFCNEKNATIHLTQVVNGNMKKLNICQDCAEKNGIDLNSPISITDILMGVGKNGREMIRIIKEMNTIYHVIDAK